MFQALNNRYDSKKLKDLVKVTVKLEKCYMKSNLEDPYLWLDPGDGKTEKRVRKVQRRNKAK